MKTWLINNGVLFLRAENEDVVPTPEQIFRLFKERDDSWLQGPDDRGVATDLKFSRYPLALELSLDDANRLQAIGTHRKIRVTISSFDVLEAGHVVTEGQWFPLDEAAVRQIREFLTANNTSLGTKISLQVFLAARQAGLGLNEDAKVDPLSFIPPADDSPQNVKATLYPYQLVGWHWCRFLVSQGLGGILADEMGLGKTLQIISAVADPIEPLAAPVLVVAPGSLLENWKREFGKFAPHLKTLKHHGPQRTGRPKDLEEYDVVITSYDAAIRDHSLFMMIPWTLLVCDEAQYIRNPVSLRARSVKKLNRGSAIAVTGTPVENRLTDLWSIADFVLPDYLGNLPDFQKLYEDSVEGAAALERAASPIMLRRRVAEVATDLPERIEIPQVVELDDNDASAYDALREQISAEFGASATLVALTKLRMFCTHPSLVQDLAGGDPAAFGKYARLVDILDEIFEKGEKAILFTAYTGMSDILVEDIARRFGVFTGFIDGRVAIDDRQPLLDRFAQVTGAALLVLNPRAGGAGLNITAANHVIHYTLEWNPALEDQASARVHRRGQTLPVTVHRLFCAGTVEEVVDDRLERKRALSDTAVVGVSGREDDYQDILAALKKSPLAQERSK